jgi:hypothetical protein
MIRLIPFLLAGAALAETPVPGSVPQPFTAAEADAFRLSVARCWNVPSGEPVPSVTLAFRVGADRRPVPDSIRLLGPDGDDPQVQAAFQSARRAVLRCGAAGFDLPDRKQALWGDVEMTFAGGILR